MATREMLLDITNALARDGGGGYRFPRFWLIHWLMMQELARGASIQRRLADLRRRLSERAMQPVARKAHVATDAVPGWVKVLACALGPWLLRVRHSGRLPGLGRHYRWFLRRQPYLAPGLHRSFFELAERLTDGQWQHEDPEQVRRLLVNAFLADLREAFRGIGWLRRFRTTVPIVLLHGVTDTNGGNEFLRTVSEVRNDTGLFDPLLLVTRGPGVPDPSPAPAPPYEGCHSVLGRWRRRLPQDRRRRDVGAWIIVGNLRTCRISDGRPAFEHPSRPLLRTRAAAIALAVVLGGGYAVSGVVHDRASCGDGFTWIGIEPVASDVVRIDDACIGVTDGSNPLVLPGGPDFDRVRQTILDQNRLALEVQRRHPSRPLVTLVKMGAFTAPAGAADDTLSAEREELMGLSVVQATQLAKPNLSYEPLVRVLIANGGPHLLHGTTVAEQLGRMTTSDPGIVAVLGPSESRETTSAAIQKLATIGLPTVSAVLSTDSRGEVNHPHFQIAPQNARQAAVAAAYADQLVITGGQPAGRPLARSARIYLSDDPGDFYSQNLAADLRSAFGGLGFHVETVAFTPGDAVPGGAIADRNVADPGLAGRDACDWDGVVLYAGRGNQDFPAFVDGVGDRCGDRPPYLLGGSDLATYVADRDVSRANRSVPFDYLSPVLAPELGGQVPAEAHDFYARLNRLFPDKTTDRGRSLDGRAALTYDAAYTVVVAASYLSRDGIVINGGTLGPALISVTDAAGAQRRYQGVTGPIDFGGTVSRRVPLNRPVTIVNFADGLPKALDQHIVCAGGDDPMTQPWCPFDS